MTPTNKFEVYILLGDACEDDMTEAKAQLDRGCGSAGRYTFNTKAELDAFFEGIEAMSGYDSYQTITKADYDIATGK